MDEAVPANDTILSLCIIFISISLTRFRKVIKLGQHQTKNPFL